MSSTKKDNIKEITNQIKESTTKYLDEQNQQTKDTTSDISDTTNRVNENISEYQRQAREFLKKASIQQANINNKLLTQFNQLSNNYIELQKNFPNTFQSTFSKFIDDNPNHTGTIISIHNDIQCI